MRYILCLILLTSLKSSGQKTLQGNGITNIGNNMIATMNGSDSIDRYKSAIGRKIFSRLFANVDSIETITSLGSDLIFIMDATTGKFKKITGANLGAGGVPVSSGTYTPTLTNIANLDASSAFVCQYMRVGNTVTVSGRVTVNPTTTSTDTQLGVSLPIASDFANTEDCGGVAAAHAVVSMSAGILADQTNNRAIIEWVATDVNSNVLNFTFTYRIL